MITCNFSVVEDVIRIDKNNINYVADPSDFFTMSFNGNMVHGISGETLNSLYGKLLICWMDGVNSFFVILKPNNIIHVDGDDYILCKYLANYSYMVSGLDDIDDVRAFAHL